MGQKSEVTKLRPLKLEPGVDLLLPPVDRVLLVVLHVLLLPVSHLHRGQEPAKSNQCKIILPPNLPQCLHGAVEVLHTRREAPHQQDLDKCRYIFLHSKSIFEFLINHLGLSHSLNRECFSQQHSERGLLVGDRVDLVRFSSQKEFGNDFSDLVRICDRHCTTPETIPERRY